MNQTYMNIGRGWFKKTTPVFILACLVVLFFSDVIFGNKIFMHRDLLRFFYPLREFSAAQFSMFHIPLWNPYIHCGSPHLAELQTCVFYPLSVIYQLFSYPQAFNYFIVLHVFLAGFFTYLLMRHWGYSRYASFFSGSIFTLSGYMISVINLPASLASVTWLPLAILFYDKALKDQWVKNSIITGIFLALMFLGGEPAILLATVFIFIILGIADSLSCGEQGILFADPSARCGSSRSQNTLPAATSRFTVMFKIILVTLLVTAGLSAFQILPFIEFLAHTSRSAMDFNEAGMWSLPPYALLDMFVPYLSETDYLYKDYWTRQSWLLVYYMGLFTMMCAFIAMKFDVTKERKAFFYILALGLVLSFGRYTPLYYFLYKFMPGFGLSRYPVKFFFMVAFSLAILAGMGLEYYMMNVRSSRELRMFLRSILILAFIGGLFYFIMNFKFFEIFNFSYKNISDAFLDKKDQLSQLLYVAMFNIKRAIGYFMLLSVVLFIGASRKIKLNLIIPFLLLVSIVDIYTGNKKLYLNMDIDEYVKPGDTIEFLQKDRSLYRVFASPAALSQNMFVPEKDYFEGVHALKERLVSDRGVGFGIYDAYGYGSLYNKRHEEIIKLITLSDLPSDTNLLNLLNIKYVISPKDFEAKGYTLAKRTGKVNIYENKNVLPRAFLADEAVVIKNGKEILKRIKGKDFNPAEKVILEEDVSFASDKRPLDMTRGRQAIGDKVVNILKYLPGEVIIEVKTGAAKFLVLSDSYYPGWKAYVDNKHGKIYRANYILRAVYLEPGRHIVRFTYEPFSFKIGLIVTFGTVFSLIAIWIRKK